MKPVEAYQIQYIISQYSPLWQGNPSRIEQANSVADACGRKGRPAQEADEFEEDGDAEACMKRPACKKPGTAGGRGRGGRGRGGRGGRGRGRGQPLPEHGPHTEAPDTPPPKIIPSMNDAPEDLETPPKVSAKKPAAKAKAKAKQAKQAKQSKQAKPKSSPKKKKASPKKKGSPTKKPQPTSTQGKCKKRVRHGDDDKSFARRAKPQQPSALAHWTVIRDVFNDKLASHFGAASSHQDWYMISTCTSLAM